MCLVFWAKRALQTGVFGTLRPFFQGTLDVKGYNSQTMLSLLQVPEANSSMMRVGGAPNNLGVRRGGGASFGN